MSEHKSRRKFIPVLSLLLDEQKAAIDADGRERYPELASIGTYGRHFSPAHRDALAFWMAHKPLFLTWVANRGNPSPTQEDTP